MRSDFKYLKTNWSANIPCPFQSVVAGRCMSHWDICGHQNKTPLSNPLKKILRFCGQCC